MINKYYSVNEIMKNEINSYSIYLANKIYDNDEELVEPIDDMSFQILKSDDNLEQLYSELLKYVNNRTTNEESVMYKQMIMAHYYEYINTFYNEIDHLNQQIYLKLDNDLSLKNVINLFNEYGRDIIEMYDYILSVYDSFPEITNKIRKNIIDDNKLNKLFQINPGSIFDYRFLMGCKFDGEQISSIKMGNILIKIVKRVNMESDNEDVIINTLQKLIETEPQIQKIVDDNKSYIISNIYAHFNAHHSKDITINGFISFMENNSEDVVLESINIDNQGLSYFLYIFYLLNQEGLTEQKVKQLIDENKKQKKYRLIKIYNPYYLEEEEYFNHRGSQNWIK